MTEKNRLLSISWLIEPFYNPLNSFLLLVSVFMIYKIFKIQKKRSENETNFKTEEHLVPMKKQDFTLNQLLQYDGVSNPRILLAINEKVFDVTAGRSFYGPGGGYSIFAGRDASRGLGTFSLDTQVLRDEYDDLSDLAPSELDSIREWELQFTERYPCVGKLLRPGEAPTDYSDTEDSCVDSSNTALNRGSSRNQQPASDDYSDSPVSVNEKKYI